MQKLYYCTVKNFHGKVIKRFTGNTHVFALPINDTSFYYMALVGKVKNKQNIYIAVKIAELNIEFQKQFVIEEARFFKKRFNVVDILPCLPIFEDDNAITINVLKPGTHIFSDLKLKYLDAYTEAGADIRFYSLEGNLDLQEDEITPTKTEVLIKFTKKMNYLGGLKRISLSRFSNQPVTTETLRRRAIEEGCKFLIRESVNESLILQKLQPELRDKIYSNIDNLNYNECLYVVSNKDKIPVTEQELGEYEEGFFSKILKYGLAMFAGSTLAQRALKIPGFRGAALTRLGGMTVGAILFWLYRTLTDPCKKEAQNAPPGKKDITYSLCKIRKTTLILQHLRSEIAKCSITPNPPKCRTKLLKAYDTWQKRYQKELIKHKVLLARTKELEQRYRKGTSPYEM